MVKALIWAAVSTRAQTDEEKFSLPQQESDGRNLCINEGWEIVDVLRVPGHTRSAYMEFHKLAAAAHSKGIDAFLKLEQHWQARDFDVLIIRDGDRLARAQGVMGTIVENIIHSGARIYCFADGWVDKSNFRMWISMVGYRAAADVDKLRKFIDEGANKRAQRGLPVGSVVLWSHKLVRAENGRALYQIPDPDKELFFRDAATLILEGVSWYNLEYELFRRYGHMNEKGEPYPPRKVYSLIYNPSFWGNTARFFRDFRRKSQFKGAWAWDSGVEPPNGVVVFYNVHTPVYSGELATQIQQEAQRREVIQRGSYRSENARAFTGLIICGECGCNLVHHIQVTTASLISRWYCYTKHRRFSNFTCTQSKGMREEYVQEVVAAKLAEAIASRDLNILLGSPEPVTDDLAKTIQAQIDSLTAQAKRLIQKQGAAPDALSTMYDDQIDQIGQQLSTLRQRLLNEHRLQFSSEQRAAQEREFDKISNMPTEEFWAQYPNVINQQLHTIMGKRRWVALNGEIIDQLDAPPRKRH